MDQVNKYLRIPRGSVVNLTERGELMVWFRDKLNEANTKDHRRQLEIGEVAKRLTGIQTHDLGRDLYFIKKKMEEALGTNFPVGAVFYSTIKKLKATGEPK